MGSVRLFGVLAIACALAACKADGFACAGDGECMLGGEQGQCVGSNCAYPDAMCPSGYRYAEGLGNGLAGQCVDENDVLPPDTDATTSDPTTGTTGTSALTLTSESSDSSGAISASGADGDSTSSTSTGSTSREPTGPMTSDVTLPVTTDSLDTGVPGCGNLDCESCFECAPEDPCIVEAVVCEKLAGCPTIVACFAQCAITGLCLDNCCDAMDDQSIGAAQMLYICQAETCVEACGGAVEPTCL